MNTSSPQDNWMPMRMRPPQPFEMLEVLLDDGSVTKALWTGSKWWHGNAMIEPRAWRIVDLEELKQTG